MSETGDYFRTLGERMAADLGDVSDPDTVFAEIATNALNTVAAPPIDVLAMADWAAERQTLPKQVNFRSGFGQPPLVVFEAPGFYIEVLFWFPSRTEIHGHGFTGAFRVLDGCSLQTEYRFEEISAPEPGVRCGQLQPRELVVIGQGTVCAIEGQDEFIHAVAHLGQPSLTLVARTPGRKGIKQWKFYRCGFAHLPRARNESVIRHTDILAAVSRARPAQFTGRLLQFLRRADTITFIEVLQRLLKTIGGPAFSRLALGPVRAEFGDTQRASLEAVDESVRKEMMWQLIRHEKDPRRQVLLALDELFPETEGRDRFICEAHGVSSVGPLIDEWVRIATPGLSRDK